mmetsp:Transcript_21942/g.40052  ORF Transcript_21942/g.40052 Transcript_21942/m.40052 type:complete len:227 (+) Transcript_21942:140-820(+)
MKVWLLLASATYVLAQCPLFICQRLEENVCTTMNSRSTTFVNLNILPCKTGFCSVTKIKEWFDTNVAAISPTTPRKTLYYYCHDVDFTTYNITVNKDVECGKREKGKEIPDKIWPVRCNNSTDCTFEDGTQGECTCGYNRESYCQPDYSTSIFDGYWSQCDENDGYIDARTKVVWDWAYEYYNLIVSTPSCGDDILIELDIAYVLEGMLETAAYIGVIWTALLSSL